MGEAALKLTQDDVKLYHWLHGRNFETYAEQCLKLRDHNTAQILPFRLNQGQKILHAVVEKQKKEKGYIRVFLLKSRRFGGSTYVEGRFYFRTSLNPNRNTFIVGHEKSSTATLFRMAQLFQEKNTIAPAIIASNAQELRFDNKDGTGLKSEYQLGTAENLTSGKSQGIHYLHGSEEGFWPTGNAEDLLLNLLQCVPDPPMESEIFRESTGNGYGNTFQEGVFEAYAEGQYPYYEEDGITYAWSSPDTDWVLVFIPWFAIERYTKPFDTEEQKEQLIKECETKVFDERSRKWVKNPIQRLREKYHVTWEQLNWRKWAIANKCKGSVNKFNQEYPAEVLDAFLSRGSNVFPKELCDYLESQCKEPLIIGRLIYNEIGRPYVQRNPHGEFKVWEECKQQDSYFITVDAAGGKERLTETQKRDQKEPDRTNIDIWNHRTGVQAAQWNGHIDHDMISDIVSMIGHLYGIRVNGKLQMPIACVELINHGYTVAANLEKMKYPQYEWKQGEPGWSMNRQTKPKMVDGLVEATRESSLKIMCKETVSEMRTFVELNRKFAAAGTAKDDRVDSAGMASEMMVLLPRKYRTYSKTRQGQGVRIGNVKHQRKVEKSSYVEAYA